MITLRQLQPDEWMIYKATRLAALHADQSMFGGTYEQELLKPDAAWQATVSNPKEALFVLFDGDKPIGMTGASYDKEDPLQKTVLIWGWWVHPDYRGQGLADRLCKVCVEWAEARPEVDRIIVGHRESNEASRNVIRKNGFVYAYASMRTWPDGVTENNPRHIRFIHNAFGEFPIETERLLLRPVLASDAHMLREAKRETWAQLQQWMAWTKDDGPDEEADHLMLLEQEAKFRAGTECMLIGFEKGTYHPVIFTGFHQPDWDNRTFEIGYWVRAPAQNKGYAQEVTHALSDHAFRALNAHAVKIASAIENAASMAVITKCDFTYTHTQDASEDDMGQETHWFEKRRAAP